MEINNVFIQPKTVEKVTSNLVNAPQKYTLPAQMPDTVEFSDKKLQKKVGIAASVISSAIGLYFLLRGKKPPKEMVTELPKIEIPEEARKIYSYVDKVFHKKTKLTPEIIERNLTPKEKEGSWGKDDIKEYYTKLEKEYESKIAAEKAAKEAEAKAVEEAKLAAETAKIKAEQGAKKVAEASKENIIDFDKTKVVVTQEDQKFRNGGITRYGSKHIKANKCQKIIEDTVKECENLTFDSPNLKLIKDKYDADNVYDLALRYAVVANNTAKVKGSGAFINEIPDIFKGIEQKELVKKLDDLPALLKEDAKNKFTIGGKEFTAEFVGNGQINRVYKITDSTGKSVCFRSANDPYLINGAQGIYYETAITQEAYKAGVTDIPKLYMANPVGRYANDGHVQGSWQLLEFVNGKKEIPEKGLRLFDWLDSKGLAHFDYNEGTMVGKTVVDLGGIADRAKTFYEIDNPCWLLHGYQQGETTSQMIRAMM